MRAIFRGLARKAADNFEWLYGHHIDWNAVPGFADR